MPSAEIITIGTEILLGEILDTNAQYIARALTEIGVDLFRKTTVGDNPQRIAQAIQEALGRAQVIITTGGLGPTVDDPTREAVALAMGVETEFRPELWVQIQERFQRYGRQPTENNKRQAYMPQGAIAVENPVGTAPSFIFEQDDRAVISLPGVPREMEHLLAHAVIPYLKKHYTLNEVIKSRLVHTAGVGESMIDEQIGDLESLSNPTIGLAAHSGQVDVRITAKAASLDKAQAMIAQVEETLRQRLGNWIYGVDEQTLEQVALENLASHTWKAAVIEAGLNGGLIQRLAAAPGPFLGGEMLKDLPDEAELTEQTKALHVERQADVALGIALYPSGSKQDMLVVLITPKETRLVQRSYGGPPSLAPLWAINSCIDLLRKI